MDFGFRRFPTASRLETTILADALAVSRIPSFELTRLLARFALTAYDREIAGLGVAEVKSELSRKRLSQVRGFIDELYGHDLHVKRVGSLAGATFGVMTGASLVP